MLFIQREDQDPYFNIAAEEYVLKHIEDDTLMLWANNPSIIIGKHQNPYIECNVLECIKKNIPVIRRISGGGTVFHDKGNLNFTFTRRMHGENLIDYRLHTQPIIDALEGLGIKASLEGKNDLKVNSKKISGNAEHIFRKKVLHHGTLLFDSHLGLLNKLLKSPNSKAYKGKSMPSNPSEVGNISQYIPYPFDFNSFRDKLTHHLLKNFPGIEHYKFSNDDKKKIKELAKAKYEKDEWNYGYSPDYEFSNEIKGYQINLSIKKGLIQTAEIIFKNTRLHNLEAFLINQPHTPEGLEKLVDMHDDFDVLATGFPHNDEIIKCFF